MPNMTLRLTDEDHEALRLHSEREHRSMHAIVVEAVQEHVGGRQAVIASIMDKVMTDNAQAMEWLGQ